MKPFRILDISGDVGLTAYGRTEQEAFANAAIGMYSLVADQDAILEKRTLDISVESRSSEGLLVSWLNELIFHFDAYGFIGKRVEVVSFSCNKLTSKVSGEDFDRGRHEGKLLIKAATYHRLRIEKVRETWEIDVIFDI